MGLRVTVLLHLLLLVDRADLKKGGLSFVILMKCCLNIMGVFDFVSLYFMYIFSENVKHLYELCKCARK